jgi:hypothetical protein
MTGVIPISERRMTISFTADPTLIDAIDDIARNNNTTRSRMVETLVLLGMKGAVPE